MRSYIVLCGLLIVALGFSATFLLERPDSIGFLQGALTLGGALVICWIFSRKMPAHGIVGAGVVALLGTARGIANLPGLFRFMLGERPRGVAPVLEVAVTVISGILLFTVLRQLAEERSRRIREAAEE